MSNPYTILGVPRDADLPTIKKAYHRLAMEFHPDKRHGTVKVKEGEEKFKQANEAWETLKDATKRDELDHRLAREHSQTRNPKPAFPRTAPPPRARARSPDLNRTRPHSPSPSPSHHRHNHMPRHNESTFFDGTDGSPRTAARLLWVEAEKLSCEARQNNHSGLSKHKEAQDDPVLFFADPKEWYKDHYITSGYAMANSEKFENVAKTAREASIFLLALARRQFKAAAEAYRLCEYAYEKANAPDLARDCNKNARLANVRAAEVEKDEKVANEDAERHFKTAREWHMISIELMSDGR